MRKRLPSPALVISLVALFVALGGTGYAALRLPRNSVGTTQLENGAVVAAKIRNGTIVGSKLRNGAVTAGKIDTKGLSVPNAIHSNTALNALSAATATSATSATTATSAGTASTALSPGTLASGKTEAGTYDVDFMAATGDLNGSAAISFPFPLASAPKLEWLAPGAPADANCPGSAASPQAAAGFLCIYANADENVASYPGGGSQTYGALPVLTAASMKRTVSTGSWAVTAP